MFSNFFKIHKTLKEIKEIVNRNSYTLFVGGTLLDIYFISYQNNKKGKDEVMKDTFGTCKNY
jgi:hypothetical protein